MIGTLENPARVKCISIVNDVRTSFINRPPGQRPQPDSREKTMNDYEAVDTFQQIIAQIVKRLICEEETEEK